MSTERFQTEITLPGRASADSKVSMYATSAAAVGALSAGTLVIETYLPAARAIAYAVLFCAVGAVTIRTQWLTRERENEGKREAGEVTMGDDGLRICELDEERFVHWAEIKEIDGAKGAYRVTTRDGGLIRFKVTHDDAFSEALRRRQRAFESAPKVRVAEGYRRHGEDVGAWVSRVRSAKGGFRGTAIDQEELTRIAESPHAVAEQRIAAAIAVRDVEPLRVRVEDAAKRIANAKLSQAMLAALDDELTDELVDATL